MAQSADSTSQLAVARSGRLTDAYIAAGCVFFLVAAHLLTPSPSGFGTHEEIIPVPCPWRAMTGVPCPGCGLTTSVTWTAHGRLDRAFACHYLGPFVYVAGWVMLAWSLLALGFGVPSPTKYLSRRRFLQVLVTIYLGAWIVRLTVMAVHKL
jgi:Protein of unknown function (DUF2752)